jgi:predicted alpha/beta superfamily hydrolase
MRLKPDLLWKWGSGFRAPAGTLETIPDVASRELGNARDLGVWLPGGYARSVKRYPVIYMHDGQNLFDPAQAFAEPWRVQDAMRGARRRGVEAIVVGIPNRGLERIDEYSPFEDPARGGGRADLYVDWILGTVKPLIDARYRTRPEREATGMAGSSLGGLVTLYAFFRPDAPFGFAAALSPSLWFAGGAIFPFVSAAAFAPGRLYLDAGGREGAGVLEDARRMRDLLVGKGYRAGSALRFVEDAHGRHHESDWGRRLTGALPFLLQG